MNAGRELDALIATKIMGWTVKEFGRPSTWHGETEIGPSELWVRPGATVLQSYAENRRSPPSYSTDMNATMTVVDKIANETGLRLELRALLNPASLGYRGYEAAFTGNKFGQPVVAATASEAICLAALKVVQV